MLNENFVYVGIGIGLLGLVKYISEVVKGNVKPNRVTFLMWSLAPLIAFAAEIKQGVGIQSLLTLISGFACLSILIISLFIKKAEWKLNVFDVTCGVLSFIGLILWFITRTANVAIIFSLTSDILASTPTIIKAYKYPETENAFAYLTGVIECVLVILTIKTWNFATWGYPVYTLILDLSIYIFAQFKISKSKFLV